MSNIVLAGKYASIHTKNWAVPPKPEPIRVERKVRGPVKLKMGRDGHKRTSPVTMTFDSPEEMLKGMQQDTESKLEKYRWPDQDSFTNVQKQYGKGMWSHELVAKILKCNRKLFVEDSKNIPGSAGFYKVVGGVKATAGIPNASFRHGFMPEATIMKEDRAGLAVEFIYGWRQVLIRLRKSGDLTAAQFRRLYGVVEYSDERGKHFASNLGHFKV